MCHRRYSFYPQEISSPEGWENKCIWLSKIQWDDMINSREGIMSDQVWSELTLFFVKSLSSLLPSVFWHENNLTKYFTDLMHKTAVAMMPDQSPASGSICSVSLRDRRSPDLHPCGCWKSFIPTLPGNKLQPGGHYPFQKSGKWTYKDDSFTRWLKSFWSIKE